MDNNTKFCLWHRALNECYYWNCVLYFCLPTGVLVLWKQELFYSLEPPILDQCLAFLPLSILQSVSAQEVLTETYCVPHATLVAGDDSTWYHKSFKPKVKDRQSRSLQWGRGGEPRDWVCPNQSWEGAGEKVVAQQMHKGWMRIPSLGGCRERGKSLKGIGMVYTKAQSKKGLNRKGIA